VAEEAITCPFIKLVPHDQDDSGRCLRLLTDLLEGAPGTDELAHTLRDFLHCFEQLTETEQDEIRSLLTAPEARKIASLSVTAAQRALIEKDEQWLVLSLRAHDVEQFRDDPRNNFRLLVVTYYAAQQLGTDPRELFRRVAGTVSPRSASHLRDFANRSPALCTLEAMGIRAVSRGERVQFVFE
jgi:hypothetical protein